MSDRLSLVRSRLSEANVPALLVSNGDNRRYLSGFTGSAGYLLILPDHQVLLTDFRYTEQASEQAPAFEVRLLKQGLLKALAELKSDLGLSKVGIESAALTLKAFQELEKAAAESGIELEPTSDIVEPIRRVKDSAELATTMRAIELADRAVDEVSATIRPGMTERAVAWAIERHMREGGAEGMAFEVIVGSGPRGAMPHARAGDRLIEAGDPIVLDLGCIVDGYRSDLTRTVCFGEPSDRYLEIYEIVLQAQRAAFDGIQAGMKAGDADKLARDYISERGFGEQFGHSLGHGIGLETHEAPFLRKEGEEILEAGMIFSVEPGIYLPGEFGVRIEDLVVVEANGIRVLSQARKSPVIGRNA